MSLAVLFALALGGLAVADGGLLAPILGASGSIALTYIVSFVIALSVLIFIHELGHFLVAKWVGVGVERFSLGFGPRLWSFRRGETEYCISVVPLGGYVKMHGEEAHGEDAIHPAADPAGAARINPLKSFVLKPLWARALIVFAGPGMNFVLAAVIFSLIFAAVGIPVFPTTVGRVVPDSPAAQAGLQPGDEVLAVDGRPIRHWGQLDEEVARSEGRPLSLTVASAGTRRQVTVTPRRMPARTPFGEPTEVWSLGTGPYLAPVVGEVKPGMPAAEAGLRPRDRIVAIDGQAIRTWDEMAEIISKRAGETLTLTIERNGQRQEVALTPRAVTERDPLGHEVKVARIGIGQSSPQTYLRLNPAAAVWRGLQRTWDVTLLTLVSFWKLLTGIIPASNIGGPVQIGMAAGQAAQEGFVPYAFLVAVISINLAILNLLPVPMLDGGHLLFFAIEGVLGRALSVRKREIAQQIGLALLLLLMVFAIGNDILRLPLVGRLFK
ncbi:MAG TPA: RIP metalloprotease RseP [Methylomirabilota bacterium]|nr:RIP metalloprotease RseP [Methylomirabilota bacterium]